MKTLTAFFLIGLLTLVAAGAPQPDPAGIRLEYAIGIGDGAKFGRDGSDGVFFRVELLPDTAGGAPVVLTTDHWAKSAWKACAVDLTPYAGRTVRLRLVTAPGTTTTYDWACWAVPVITRGGKKIADLTAYRLWRTGILPADGGKPLPMDSDRTGATFSFGKRICGGEARPSIFAHPPWKDDHEGDAAFGEFLVPVGEPPPPPPRRPPLPSDAVTASPFPLGLAPSFRLEKPLTIDGSLDDWPALNRRAPLVLRESRQLSINRVSHKPGWKGGWAGPRDLSATVYLAWDDSCFYVAEIRHDDRLQTQDVSSAEFQRADSLRLCFSRGGETSPVVFAISPEAQQARPAVRRITYDARGRAAATAAPQVRLAPVLCRDGWIQEIAIPFRALGGKPKAGETLRFQLILTDADTPMEKHYEMLWRPKKGKRYWYDPKAYGSVSLCRRVFPWLRLSRTIYAVGERPVFSCGLFPPESGPATARVTFAAGNDSKETPFLPRQPLPPGGLLRGAALTRAGRGSLRYTLACAGEAFSGTIFIDTVDDPPENRSLAALGPPATPTLVPSLANPGVEISLTEADGRAVFRCRDGAESLTYAVRPGLGFDVEIRQNDRLFFHTDPAVAGPRLVPLSGGTSAGDTPRVLAVRVADGHLTYQCHVSPNTIIAYDYSLEGKTLRLDLSSPDGAVAEVRGPLAAMPGSGPVFVPYLHPVLGVYRRGNLFFSSYADWTVTGASRLGRLGCTVYTPKTDGTRNPLRERLFLTVSPRFAEVLANLPNPPSPYRDTLAKKVVMDCWTWGGRFADTQRYLETLKGYGVDELAIIFHVWQNHGYDNGLPEHLPANKHRGGDLEMRLLGTTAKRLGYLFALHENYIDYYPNFPGYTDAAVALNSRGGKIDAWYMPSTGIQSYRLKPSWIMRYVNDQSPRIHRRYRTTAAYLDVHSVSLPFQIDFDAKAPGAASLRYSFERIDELFRSMRKIHGGPLFGEGNYHAVWAGRIDGCEAQIGGRGGENAPIFPDYDLLKVHPLAVNHGVGYYSRWHRQKKGHLNLAELTKYRAEELAYGHAGFFSTGTMPFLSQVLGEYYLMQPLQSRYALARIRTLEYLFDPDPAGGGRWVSAQVACRTAAPRKIHAVYANGFELWVNDERDNWKVDGRILPPYGFVARGQDVVAWTARLGRGLIGDYVETPERLFVNPRTARVLYKDTQRKVTAITPLEPKIEPLGERKFRVTYRWDVRERPDKPYHIFVHFTDSGGNILWQNDHSPTPAVTDWPLGGVFADGPYEVEIPSGISPGVYSIRVGMYQPKVGRLALDGIQDDSPAPRYRVGRLTLRDKKGKIHIGFEPPRVARPTALPGLNPADARLDFGPVVTGVMLRLDRVRDGLLLMPVPHGQTGTVVLRLDRVLPGRSLKNPVAMALDGRRKILGRAALSRDGRTLTLEMAEKKAWFYKITRKK